MRWRLWIGLVLLAGMWTAPGQPAAFSNPRHHNQHAGTSLTGTSAPTADTAPARLRLGIVFQFCSQRVTGDADGDGNGQRLISLAGNGDVL